MIRYLKHHEIDFLKWDACIDHSINGIVYAYAWYLDMVCPSWDALVEDDYASVMPLPTRVKWGVRYIYQPYFVQQLGVFSKNSLSSDVISRFLAAIPSAFWYADISLNTYNVTKPLPGFRLYKLKTYELDLIQDYQAICQGFSTNTMRNLKKSKKNGVFVAPGGQPEEIIRYFRQNKGREVGSFSDQDYLVLKHLVYAGIHKGMVKTYSAYSSENNFCAGAIFYRSHQKVVFLFSATTEMARSNGAMFLIIDQFIREHAGQELVLDFEGSSDPNLARFYSGFGSKECVFLRVVFNRMPFYLKPLPLLYTLLRHGTSGDGIKVQEK